MPEPQPVLIVRSLGLGVVLGLVAGAVLAGLCKLIAPDYDAGGLVVALGLVAIVITTLTMVRRGDRPRSVN